MSKVTELASGQLNGHDGITVELVEAGTHPAVIVITWPDKPTVLHPQRFPDTAATLARLFATAATELARNQGQEAAVTAAAALLDQIRDRLITEAEQAVAHAERYRFSKRYGERNSAPVYLRRGHDALAAVTLLDQHQRSERYR